MDDSSIFIQWAMETLGQGQHAAVAGDAFSSSPFLEPRHSAALQSGTDVAAHRYGATDSRSSGNRGAAMAMENDGRPPSCSTNYPAVSWNFTSGIARPRINEAIPTSPAAPGHGEREPEPARRSPLSTKSSTASNGTASTGQEHVIAERKRREKLNRHFIELSSVIPGLKKMDKTTILSDAVRYVKEQQEKLKALQDRDERTIDSVELVKRPCISNVNDGSPSPPPSAVARTSPTPAIKTSLPEIDARILERNVMVRIHCEDGKGILVALLAEVEGLHLTITHTNVMSFPASTLIINLMAKVDEGFNITMEDIVCKLDSALGRRRHGGNNNMEDRMNMKMLIKN